MNLIGNQPVDEDAALNVALSATDPDAGDTLSLSEIGLPGFCNLSDNGDGTGSLDCSPGFDDAGTYPVTVTVMDDGTPNLDDSESFDIVVGGTNRTPTLDPIGNQPVDEDAALNVALSATDPDAGDT